MLSPPPVKLAPSIHAERRFTPCDPKLLFKNKKTATWYGRNQNIVLVYSDWSCISNTLAPSHRGSDLAKVLKGCARSRKLPRLRKSCCFSEQQKAYLGRSSVRPWTLQRNATVKLEHTCQAQLEFNTINLGCHSSNRKLQRPNNW